MQGRSNTRLDMFLHMFFTKISRKSRTNKLSPKWTNPIWLEPSKLVHQQYHHEIIQKLTHNKNRSKIVLTSKLKFKISPWISNENARFKLHSTLCQRIYLCHMLIARINGIEVWPYGDAVAWFDGFKMSIAETDDAWCCRRCVEVVIQLSNARGRRIFELPWTSASFNSCYLGLDSMQLAPTET